LADPPPQQSAAERYADTVVATWREIAAALQPVFGQTGSLALYRRSLQLTEASYPWLAPLSAAPSPIDPALLRQVLTSTSHVEAVAASNAWFRSFQQLLSALIGPSLSSRILKPIWTHPGTLAVPTGRRND
jgi:hypothetical protein